MHLSSSLCYSHWISPSIRTDIRLSVWGGQVRGASISPKSTLFFCGTPKQLHTNHSGVFALGAVERAWSYEKPAQLINGIEGKDHQTEHEQNIRSNKDASSNSFFLFFFFSHPHPTRIQHFFFWIGIFWLERYRLLMDDRAIPYPGLTLRMAQQFVEASIKKKVLWWFPLTSRLALAESF